MLVWWEGKKAEGAVRGEKDEFWVVALTSRRGQLIWTQAVILSRKKSNLNFAPFIELPTPLIARYRQYSIIYSASTLSDPCRVVPSCCTYYMRRKRGGCSHSSITIIKNSLFSFEFFPHSDLKICPPPPFHRASNGQCMAMLCSCCINP